LEKYFAPTILIVMDFRKMLDKADYVMLDFWYDYKRAAQKKTPQHENQGNLGEYAGRNMEASGTS